ncbi:MAG: sterol desaturase family protein [Bacteroidia bacterium]|jgi:beta-carotene 3-hydroxylase|nr:sterol desaturase family protein [Bacteroidia bacterium]
MNILINIGIVIATFFFMEFMAWFTHKFVMHGFLWYLHRDHHQGKEGWFEKNDSFFLIFAVPSAYCFMTGIMFSDFRLFIGIGIALYGLCYFLVHDIIIHQRFKIWRKWNNKYVLGIRRAHKIHHKYLGKEDGENFGMLIVPMRYFRQGYKEQAG